jgi:hypothetical protein
LGKSRFADFGEKLFGEPAFLRMAPFKACLAMDGCLDVADIWSKMPDFWDFPILQTFDFLRHFGVRTIRPRTIRPYIGHKLGHFGPSFGPRAPPDSPPQVLGDKPMQWLGHFYCALRTNCPETKRPNADISFGKSKMPANYKGPSKFLSEVESLRKSRL